MYIQRRKFSFYLSDYAFFFGDFPS